jgi:hypothetical protein
VGFLVRFAPRAPGFSSSNFRYLNYPKKPPTTHEILLALIFKFGLLTAQIPSLHEPAFSSIYEAPTAPQKITGKILNLPPEATDTLEVGFAAVSVLADEQKELSVPLNPDGTFSLDLPENYPLREVWFWLGNYYYGVLLVENELSIELDFAVLSRRKCQRELGCRGHQLLRARWSINPTTKPANF